MACLLLACRVKASGKGTGGLRLRGVGNPRERVKPRSGRGSQDRYRELSRISRQLRIHFAPLPTTGWGVAPELSVGHGIHVDGLLKELIEEQPPAPSAILPQHRRLGTQTPSASGGDADTPRSPSLRKTTRQILPTCVGSPRLPPDDSTLPSPQHIGVRRVKWIPHSRQIQITIRPRGIRNDICPAIRQRPGNAGQRGGRGCRPKLR
jgi:hypothetical protein